VRTISLTVLFLHQSYLEANWEKRRYLSTDALLNPATDRQSVPTCTLPSWTANDDLRRFLAGFLQQLDVDGSNIVNNRIAIDYILELTSGVTGRIVELVRLSARCAVRRDSRIVTIDLLQEAGKEFAADLGSERNVSH
jgi:hypothetical protein